MSDTLYGRAAIPEGDYVGTSGAEAGFTNIGYISMIEVSKGFNNTIYWTTSHSLAINGFPELQLTASGPVLTLDIGVGLIVNKVNFGLRLLNISPKHIEDSGIIYSTIKLPVFIKGNYWL